MPATSEFAPGAPAPMKVDQFVLVVEDEAVLRRFAVRVLEQDGFRVLQATDGMEALDLLHRRAEPIDVLVTDVIMPRMNGVELMRALSVSHPCLPIVLMSGYAYPELSARGIEPPCSILAKPFPPELLLAEVRRCVRQRDGGSSAA